MEQFGSHWMEFREICHLSIFQKSVNKLQFHQNQTRIKGSLHEDQPTFLIISHSSLLRLRNILNKSCRENQKTHFVFNDFFFNCAIYEVMWKNVVEPGRQQMTTWRMHIALHCIAYLSLHIHTQNM